MVIVPPTGSCCTPSARGLSSTACTPAGEAFADAESAPLDPFSKFTKGNGLNLVGHRPTPPGNARYQSDG